MTSPSSHNLEPNVALAVDQADETQRNLKTLADFLREILEHRNTNPDHGTNCICMDSVAREMRAQIREVIPNPTMLTVRENATELDALGSFNHVLGMIIRWFR